MGYLHKVVVNDVGEVVGGQLVGTLVEHFVVEYVALYHHIAAYHVVHVHFRARLNHEAHDVLLSVCDASLGLFLAQGERVGHLKACVRVILEVLYLGAFCLQFFGSIECYVGFSLFEELLYILLVDVATLALTVGTVLSAEGNAFVELDSEPAERLDDVVFGSGNEAVGVGIFNAEHQIAAMLACEKVVVQCCTNATDVQRTGGTWCETHPDFSLRHILFCYIFLVVDAGLPRHGRVSHAPPHAGGYGMSQVPLYGGRAILLFRIFAKIIFFPRFWRFFLYFRSCKNKYKVE